MFHPLFRLYLPVMVQVGAQVAVTAKPGTGIILQQQQHKHMQGVLLEKGACIGRATALVKTAFPPPGISAPASGQTDDVYSGKHRDPLLQPGTGRDRIKAVS